MQRFILLFTLTLCYSMLFGQSKEGVRMMSQGQKNSFTVTYENGSAKDLADSWTKFMKKYKGKTKKLKKTEEYFTDNAVIKEMSTNTVDVYSTFIQNGDYVDMVVWFDLGGAFLSSEQHPDAIPTLTKMTDEFGNIVKKAAIEEELKEQETVLKKMSNEFDGLVKDKENLESDIVKFEQKIEEAKKKIEENLVAQERKTEEINGQQKVVEKVKTSLTEL